MVLDHNGKPCEKVKIWEDLGKSPSGTKILRSKVVLQPVEDGGWTKEIVMDVPYFNNKKGVYEVHTYRFRADSVRCASCKTSQYVYLKLMGWNYWEIPIKGTGVVSRCFKHDITTGPADPELYAEEIGIRTVTKEEALQILEKYGQQGNLT